MKRKILIMGLPGAGKSTLANTLAPLLNAVVFNADAVRANLSRDLGFSHEDRVEHARPRTLPPSAAKSRWRKAACRLARSLLVSFLTISKCN